MVTKNSSPTIRSTVTENTILTMKEWKKCSVGACHIACVCCTLIQRLTFCVACKIGNQPVTLPSKWSLRWPCHKAVAFLRRRENAILLHPYSLFHVFFFFFSISWGQGKRIVCRIQRCINEAFRNRAFSLPRLRDKSGTSASGYRGATVQMRQNKCEHKHKSQGRQRTQEGNDGGNAFTVNTVCA